jgi:hypothetical protein
MEKVWTMSEPLVDGFPPMDARASQAQEEEFLTWLDTNTGADIVREVHYPEVGPQTLQALVTDFQHEARMDLERATNRVEQGAVRYPLEATEALSEFVRLVNAHDLTWDFADDSQSRRRGHEQLKAIQRLARDLPTEDVTRIWNAMVDRSLVPEGRRHYYWHDPQERSETMQQALHGKAYQSREVGHTAFEEIYATDEWDYERYHLRGGRS